MKKIKALNLLLVAAVFPLAALVARDYLVYRTAPVSATGPGPVEATGAERAELMDYAPVVETGAFPSKNGELRPISIEQTSSARVTGTTPLTSLVLSGTYVGTMSYAIIVDKSSGTQDVFTPGEKVFDAGVLKTVERNRVILDVNGSTAYLEIPEDLGEEAMRSAVRQSQRGRPGGGPRLSKKVGEREWVIDRGAVLDSLKDMSKIMTDARLTPRTENGKVVGFLITEIRRRGVFDALGLKNGDVLRRVNGYAIDSPEKAVQVLSSLRGQKSIKLDLVRGGKPMSFSYDIR